MRHDRGRVVTIHREALATVAWCAIGVVPRRSHLPANWLERRQQRHFALAEE